MKNMKKIGVIVAVCILAVMVLTACSNKPSSETLAAIEEKYAALGATITELVDLANTYGVDETNAASLNELKAAVEEIGVIIANDLPKMSDDEGKGVIEQIDILQEQLNGFYALFE